MRGKLLLLAASVLLLPGPRSAVLACSNYLITRGASADGSTMISYSADSHVLFGELYYTPAADHLDGATLRVFEWDTGKYLGEIRQVPHTYAVVGNMNEHQVSIGETTYGGREELVDPKAVMDYGSLMYITLQRARSAREAIQIMGELVAEYGYCSSGESFSVADPNEVWILEMIGKGPENKGAVWVARRVPDGYICAHANHSRIRQFPLDDPENCLYAPDVISFARDKGWFTGQDEEFSFADTYAPADFGALRFCEARVWAFFRRAAPSLNLPVEHVMGDPAAAPLPLWIKPDRPLAVHDVMELMRDHFQGTELYLGRGVGAGPFGLPYRWRPLTWKVDDVEYCNERSTSTQQTGFSFVAQARSWLPDPVGGVLWFGVDDTNSTVYVPMYCGIRRVPHSFAVGTGSFQQFTWESAFWVFNFVANYSYLRYSDMIRDIKVVQRELEGEFLARQPEVEEEALSLHATSPERAREFLTEYSVGQGERTTKRWMKLGEQLLFKYLDGNVKDEHGKPTHPGYPEEWLRRIVQEDGELLKVLKKPGEE
ncbi:MAG: C69 family dipeptidase [Planctomycetes bacterium]|nr:C69 family dipeptidase [Planctomycetota bacterium]